MDQQTAKATRGPKITMLTSQIVQTKPNQKQNKPTLGLVLKSNLKLIIFRANKENPTRENVYQVPSVYCVSNNLCLITYSSVVRKSYYRLRRAHDSTFGQHPTVYSTSQLKPERRVKFTRNDCRLKEHDKIAVDTRTTVNALEQVGKSTSKQTL